MIMNKEIYDYLDLLYGNAKCELNYNKDYELLIAVMLSAQTTDKKVNKVTDILFKKYQSIEAMSKAPISDIEDIIREIGTFRRKAIYVHEITKKLFDDGLDYVPNDRKYIENLPGVGHKSANVFLSNIYNEPAIAVDTHVDRVSKRLALASRNDDVLKVEKKLMKKIPKDRWSKLHHQLVLFGRYHCKAINPNCKECQITDYCKYYKKNK